MGANPNKENEKPLHFISNEVETYFNLVAFEKFAHIEISNYMSEIFERLLTVD